MLAALDLDNPEQIRIEITHAPEPAEPDTTGDDTGGPKLPKEGDPVTGGNPSASLRPENVALT